MIRLIKDDSYPSTKLLKKHKRKNLITKTYTIFICSRQMTEIFNIYKTMSVKTLKE